MSPEQLSISNRRYNSNFDEQNRSQRLQRVLVLNKINFIANFLLEKLTFKIFPLNKKFNIFKYFLF